MHIIMFTLRYNPVQDYVPLPFLLQTAGSKQQTPIENIDIPRFQGVIPVDELQVRSSTAGDTDKHGMWELVHCKSETEGRPERLFQFAR